MRLLLVTHPLLWWIYDAPLLSNYPVAILAADKH
jgi:hypothetical protein